MSVYNFFTKEKIDIPELYKIKEHDTLYILKEKIFLSYSEVTLISLETMALSVNGMYIDSNFDYIKNQKIYVFNLIDELTGYIINNMIKFLDVSIDSKEISLLFKSLKNIYVDLTLETLKYIIDYILLKNLPMFVDKDKIDRELTRWNEIINISKKLLIYKYKILYLDVNKDILKKFINFDEHGNFVYSIITAYVSYKISNIDTDISSKIIKEFPVDKKIPLVFYYEKNKTVPSIKIYSKISKDLVKEWVLNSNKDNVYKQLKNINFKLLRPNSNIYSTVIYNQKTYKISIRCSWNRDNNTRFSEINDCSLQLNNFINKFKNILHDTGNLIKLVDKNISYINLQFIINKYISQAKLKIALKDFKDILEIDETLNRKNSIKIIYIPSKIVILIKETEIITEYTDAKNLKTKVNLIDIINIYKEYQIDLIISLILKLFIKAENKNPLIFKNDKLIQEPTVKTVKEIDSINIKKLKEKGVNVNAVSCQKIRQPSINEIDTPLTYELLHKNNRFICNNNPYIYPGFTNKNIVCCFKKDQKTKKVYLRNVNLNSKVKETIPVVSIINDTNLLNRPILKSNKILEQNRLGILPNYLYNIFDNKYIKLGNIQNKTSILNALNLVTNKDITVDYLIKFIRSSNKNFQIINNTEFSINEYINYLKKEILDDTVVLELLSFIFKMNILIFKESSLICKEKSNSSQFEDTVFLLKTNYYYEIIVEKISKNKIKKIFNSKNDLIVNKINDIYNKSCIVKYIGYPEVPSNFIELLKKGIIITGQVINNFNNIIYVNTKNFGIIPIIPSLPINGIKYINVKKHLLNASKQYDLLVKSNIPYIYPIGQILNKKEIVIGLLLKCGLTIPTKPQSKKIDKLSIVYRQFIPDIDNLLFNEVPSLDSRFNYILRVKFFKELYQRFRYTLSKKLTDQDRNIITKTSKTSKENISNLINNILQKEVIFINSLKIGETPYKRDVCSSQTQLNSCNKDTFCISKNKDCRLAIDHKLYNNFIKKLTLELINGNKEILNDNISNEIQDKNDFIKREDEVLLLNEEDIKNFLY